MAIKDVIVFVNARAFNRTSLELKLETYKMLKMAYAHYF